MSAALELFSARERDDYALAELMRRVVRAREDVFEFFDLVMRHDDTRAPVRIAPHQRLGIQFMLDHPRSVHMWPIGTSKTFVLVAMTLWQMGRDPSMRGAVVSADQGIAAKTLKVVRDYIEQSEILKLVFPKLRPSTRKGDMWSQTALTIDRPAGIKDATLIAAGINGGMINGSRLNWMIVDDILNLENTNTKEARDKTHHWVDSTCLSRLDPGTGRVAIVNTPWHPDDLLHRLEERGWATLKMEVTGGILIQDDQDRLLDGLEPWDSPMIRPQTSSPGDPYCRLTAYDPDPSNERLLWDARWSAKELAKERRRHLPRQFNQLFMMQCRDDGTSLCKVEWIDRCKALARERKVHGLSSAPFRGINEPEPLVFTGVDLAIKAGEQFDETAFFTFQVLPGGYRLILDIETGQFDGPTIIQKCFEKHERYGSVIRVESNGGQDFIRQVALSMNRSLPVKAHHTGVQKHDPGTGVQSLFIEIFNGAWIIPNDKFGACHPEVQKWVDACLNFVPNRHTADVLMATYMAREQAKSWGVLSGGDAVVETGDVGMSITSR